MGFIEFHSIMLVLHVYITCSCICYVLCCVVHIMLMIKCPRCFCVFFGLH